MNWWLAGHVVYFSKIDIYHNVYVGVHRQDRYMENKQMIINIKYRIKAIKYRKHIENKTVGLFT